MRVCVCVCSLSCVQFFGGSEDYSPPGSSTHRNQEYWSGVPFPAPGNLPNPGIKPTSLASPVLAGRFLITVPPGKPCYQLLILRNLEEINL